MKKYFILFIYLVLIGILQGATINVDIEGNGDYTSIQEGVDASVNGDTVLVYPGRYFENVDYNNKTISLGSLNLTTGERHYIRETIIDGNLENSCIVVKRSEGEGTLLCGFTITNGSGHYITGNNGNGGGVFVYGAFGAQLEIRNCIIEHNNAYNEGGGICLSQDSYVYLTGTTIRFNYASNGAGGIVKSPSSILEFDSDNLCNVYGNYATTGCMLGRGINIEDPDTIFLYADTLSFDEPDRYFIFQQGANNTYFEPNEYLVIESQHCYYDFIDADIYVSPDGDDDNSGLSPEVPIKTIANAITLCVSNPDNPNTVHLLSGYYSSSLNDQYFPLNMREYVSLIGTSRDGVFLDRENSFGYIKDKLSGYNYMIKNITFTGGEEAVLGESDLRFWGFTEEPTGSVIMDSLAFSSNVPSSVMQASSIDFEISNVIVENMSSYLVGYNAIPGNHSVIRNVICRNSRSNGLSFQSYYQTDDLPVLDVINYMSVDNSTENDLRLWSYGPNINNYVKANFINCTMMNNIGSSDSNAYIKAYQGGEINLYNTIIYGNNGCQLNLDTNGFERPSTATISHCLLQGGETGIVHQGETILNWLEGNLDYDPMLDDDYKPLDDSPVIDAGTLDLPEGIELPETDVYGNPRIYGNGVDMGAVEWQGTGNNQDEIVLKPDELMVYPNPLITGNLRDDKAKILWMGEITGEEVIFEIFNIKGQRVRTFKIQNLQLKITQVSWDLCDEAGNIVSSGVYFVRVKSAGEYLSQTKVTVIK